MSAAGTPAAQGQVTQAPTIAARGTSAKMTGRICFMAGELYEMGRGDNAQGLQKVAGR
jgi:hypothetical protein